MYNYENMRFTNRGDAVDVFNKMEEIANTYGVVFVDDYKELCNITPEYMDTKYGWFDHNINAAVIRRDYYGYFIDLPKPTLIEYGENDNHEDCSSTLSESNILTITIHTNELENPAETLADIFKHIPNIKDRMINITIM